MSAPATAPRRMMIVEDEVLISMLLEDMLQDLGYAVVAKASRLEEAVALARAAEIDAAILDVNVNGKEVFPVAEVLSERAVPFVFATGYGSRALPAAYENRPALQKPFQQEALERLLAGLFESGAR